MPSEPVVEGLCFQLPHEDDAVDHNSLDVSGAGDPVAAPRIDAATIEGEAAGDDVRLMAVAAAARHHGIELRPADYRPIVGEAIPSPASLASWAADAGLHAKAHRLRWKALFKLQGTQNPPPPVVLLMRDGTAALMVGADSARNVVWLRDPRSAATEQPVAVDELRLSGAWDGEALLIRAARVVSEADKPFNLAWLMGLVLLERRSLRDVSVASITLSALTIIPPLLVMTVVDRVVVHRSLSTLALLGMMLLIVTIYEGLLGYARREIVQVVSARVDAKLNLHVFNRLLGLPLDYFEKNPAGQINYRLAQVWKVRDFLTGKLMGTFLDMFTLVFLLPLLFWMEPTLAWIVLVCSALIAAVILAFLPMLRVIIGKQTAAESRQGDDPRRDGSRDTNGEIVGSRAATAGRMG